MKKTILAVVLLIAVLAFNNEQRVKAEFNINQWIIYLRNVDRLKQMSGRDDVPSGLLFKTIDTVNAFEKDILSQLSPQLAKDTTNKGGKK